MRLTIAGTVALLASGAMAGPATAPFEGSVRFGPTSALTIELGAPDGVDHDRLEVQGHLEAGGVLVVALLPGFAGALGDSYEIVTAAAVTGAFTYAPPSVGPGVTLALEQTGASIVLTVAPDCNGNGVPDTEEAGQDGNANGYPDVCEVSLLEVGAAGLAWTPLPIAVVYDVVAGDLMTLRATGGDFTAATQACLANDQPGTTLPHATPPPPGQGIWFLVRGVADSVLLSLDTFGPGQAGSRDAEIAASAAACP